jgi:predicted AlkP superfamily pyrophosphatase or phosphodiesterase
LARPPDRYEEELVRRTLSPLLTVFFAGVAVAQAPTPRPKLVVVIVVDQMRPDYLNRFRSHFGKGGFNLFLQRGASFAQARFQHGATWTCSGHAVVLTGSHADVHGLVGNTWYDANAGREVACAEDTSVTVLGTSAGGRSPRNLIGSTVGDELKLATTGRARVIAVAGKDRSAIMLGGHLADGAYWMRDTLVVSSTYYMKELPTWVRRFNASGAVTAYSGKAWDRLLPQAAYARLGPDDVPSEEDIGGMGRTFPHRLGPISSSRERFVAAFEASPYQNEVVVDLAMRAVTEEQLGKDDIPDVLAISFSANDIAGHAYGPDSHEVMDITIRTDRILERFFGFLSTHVGLQNVVAVLTADHGTPPLPEVVKELNPRAGAGRFNPSEVPAAIEAALTSRFGAAPKPGWVAYHSWPTAYLNLRGLQEKQVSVEDAERVAKSAVEALAGVHQAFTATELREQRNNGVESGAALSFFPARSGNIYYELRPYWVPDRDQVGTTHGSPWSYDTRVPLLWFGASIKPGVHHQTASIADIAPTLAALLDIVEPAGSRGRILGEMLR